MGPRDRGVPGSGVKLAVPGEEGGPLEESHAIVVAGFGVVGVEGLTVVHVALGTLVHDPALYGFLQAHLLDLQLCVQSEGGGMG